MFPRMRWELRAAARRTSPDGRAHGDGKCRRIKNRRRKLVRAKRNDLLRSGWRENPAGANSLYFPNHFFKTELAFPALPACRVVLASTTVPFSARPAQIPRACVADRCVPLPHGYDLPNAMYARDRNALVAKRNLPRWRDRV